MIYMLQKTIPSRELKVHQIFAVFKIWCLYCQIRFLAVMINKMTMGTL